MVGRFLDLCRERGLALPSANVVSIAGGAMTAGGRLSWLSKVKYLVILTVGTNSLLVFRLPASAFHGLEFTLFHCHYAHRRSSISDWSVLTGGIYA